MSVLLEATLRSVQISLITAMVSGLLGVVLAWLVSRTEFTSRKTVASLLSVPYALPPYLLGMAWVVLGNPTVGILRAFLPSNGAYGTLGICFVLSSVAFAFPYLELRAGFDRLDSSLEEAARISGASPVKVFRDISLPLLWPALVNGMCLAFLYALASFGVPAILGLPVRQFVLTTLIYSQLKLGGQAGLIEGFKISLLLLTIAACALGFSHYLTSLKNRLGASISGARSSRPSRIQLGRLAPLVMSVTWLWILLTLVLPWIALTLSALAPIAGSYSPSTFTLRNLSYVLNLADFHEALVNSAVLSVSVASLVVLLGFCLGFLSVRKKKPWASRLIRFFGIPFATPGTVLAFFIIFIFSTLARLGFNADYPLLLMAIAYTLKYAAVGANSLETAYTQIHPSLEEAARISGARTVKLLSTIWAPLLKQSMKAAWLLAFLPLATELTMSVLLTGPGSATLGTVLFQLQEYADQPSAAALAWMLLTLALVIGLMTRKKEIY